MSTVPTNGQPEAEAVAGSDATDRTEVGESTLTDSEYRAWWAGYLAAWQDGGKIQAAQAADEAISGLSREQLAAMVKQARTRLVETNREWTRMSCTGTGLTAEGWLALMRRSHRQERAFARLVDALAAAR